MTSQNVLKVVDVNIGRSPVRKRARYDSETGDKDLAKNLTLPNKEPVLDATEEQGIGRLDYDSDYAPTDDDTIFEKNKPDVNSSCVSMSPGTREKQVAILENVLSKETAQRLSMGEWDNFLINKNSLEHHTSKESYFDKLPDELVLCIFRCVTKQELATIARVCKRFNRLIEDESLWTRMDLSNRNIPPGELGVFIGRQLIILRLARAKIVHPPIKPGTKAACPDFVSRMMYLDLSMAEVSTESLVMILSKMVRLRKISLENVPVNDEVLVALSNNANLEVVNLPMATGIEAYGMARFLKGCQSLRELNIAWTYLNVNCITSICENLPSSMDRLNFSGCKKLMYDSHVANIVERCSALRELDLSDCTAITGKALRKISTLEELNFLSLSRCYVIKHRDFMCLRKSTSLQYLDIHGNYINPNEIQEIQTTLGGKVILNKFKFSSIARPTVGLRRSSIWNLRAHD